MIDLKSPDRKIVPVQVRPRAPVVDKKLIIFSSSLTSSFKSKIQNTTSK